MPVQMCQFHQVAIIRGCLTKNPKLLAAIELKEIVAWMKDTDRTSFEGALNDWHLKWESFLKEKTTNLETGKSHYTHKRLRSAYRSLNTNLKWLFTWYDLIEFNIPNTTNVIDGHFSDLKNKLRNHNGLSIARKKKFIDGFFKAWGLLKISKGLQKQPLWPDIFVSHRCCLSVSCSPVVPASVQHGFSKICPFLKPWKISAKKQTPFCPLETNVSKTDSFLSITPTFLLWIRRANTLSLNAYPQLSPIIE